jgi:serine/threonine-protein kinase
MNHPNVVHVYELGLDAAAPYIVMEHVAGGSLSKLGPVPWQRAMRLCASAARGLGAAHAVGIVHRDVKPANLLLADDDVVKVADFGVAKLSGAEPVTHADGLVGTVGFISPEQLAGEPADPRSDVYALGVTLRRLVTGEAPDRFIEVVARLTSFDPAGRPADGAEAARVLAEPST